MVKVIINSKIDTIYNRAISGWCNSLTNVLIEDMDYLTGLYEQNSKDKVVQELLKEACKEAIHRIKTINKTVKKGCMPNSFYLFCKQNNVDGTYIDLTYTELKSVLHMIGDDRKKNIIPLMLYECIYGLKMFSSIEDYFCFVTRGLKTT